MADTASGRHIRLHDFTIRSPQPLPKLLGHPSELALKLTVNGVDEKVLSTHGDTEDGLWKVDGAIKVCEDQLLTVTILACVEDSTKELDTVIARYSQLLAHAEARSRECYEFTVNGTISSVITLVTCYIRPVIPLLQKQRTFTEPTLSPGKSESDKGHNNSNRALTPDISSPFANVERYYEQASSLPASELKSRTLNGLGCIYMGAYLITNEMRLLERAILILGEALQDTEVHLIPSKYLDDLITCLLIRFQRTGSHDDIENAISKSQDAVHNTKTSDPDRHRYIANHATALMERSRYLGTLEDLQSGISFMNQAVELVPDGDPAKTDHLSNLGIAFETRYDRLGRVEDLETAITLNQKAVDLAPDGDLNKLKYLNNLGSSFETKFDKFGRVNDLEVAIGHRQKAVDLTSDGHFDKPIFLNGLGNALQKRFKRLGHVEDLEIAIAHKQKALDLTLDGHSDRPGRLHNLATALETRFELLGRVEDLEMAITHYQEAVDLASDVHPNRQIYLMMLGRAFNFRFELLKQPKDLRMVVIQYSMAASLPTGSAKFRLNAARYWADASKRLKTFDVSVTLPLDPYHIAIDLLPRVAWLGLSMSDQHTLLEEVGGIVREAVSAAIKAEEYETAVEWAEAGRSIAWQNLLHLRTPVNELRSAHDGLADRLEFVSRQLDMSVRGGDVRMNSATDGMVEISHSHVQLALDWDNIVAEIRSKPGFKSFLKPKSFNELGRIACDGPVVILNITNDQCDALILTPEDNGGAYVSNIPFSNFSYAKSEVLIKELKGLLSSKHLRARECRKAMRVPIDDGNGPLLERILRCLWLDVVKPIIEALAYPPRSTDLPHIWWCATGPLAFLPIHAAGLYDTEELGSKLSDYVVSSYTPTLSALLDNSIPSQEDFNMLAIAQANAPGASSIPATEVEVKKIQTLGGTINVTMMTKEEATVENVWRGMEKSNWVHLACHGHQNIKEPMKSGLLLHDGTLELQRLIEKPLPLADFAFLSACQTATGDESVAEESLHLASGMLFAGYKGVIATMWSIMDDIGPRVAEDVYRVMLKDGKPNRRVAAHALHEAVRRLREDTKVDMLHWVPFIHIGL